MDVTKAVFQIESSVCILKDKDIIIDKWTAIALEHFLTEEIFDLDQEKSFFFVIPESYVCSFQEKS